MTLSCTCDYDDYDGDGWFYYGPEDYTTLQTKRSRKCCSCSTKINVGDIVTKFTRARNLNYGSIEEKIYGEGGEIYLADWFMCEECSDLYFSLKELGFCISLGYDSMQDLLKEYQDVYGKT